MYAEALNILQCDADEAGAECYHYEIYCLAEWYGCSSECVGNDKGSGSDDGPAEFDVRKEQATGHAELSANQLADAICAGHAGQQVRNAQ